MGRRSELRLRRLRRFRNGARHLRPDRSRARAVRIGIDTATATCGACGGNGGPHRVCEAESALTDTDALRDASSADWPAVVDGYAWVIELALQAEQSC